MSDIAAGAKAVLEVRRTEVGTPVEVTGVLLGTDNLTYGRAFNTRNVPGARGRAGSQSTPFGTYDFSHVSDSNSVNDPLYQDGNGKRVWCTWYPEGKNSGKPAHAFQAVINTTFTVSFPDMACTWNVSYMVDGTPVISTQAELEETEEVDEE